jgi:hypothetical protein
VKGSCIAPNRKRWEEWVSEDEARRLEDAVAPEMEALGYERYTAR